MAPPDAKASDENTPLLAAGPVVPINDEAIVSAEINNGHVNGKVPGDENTTDAAEGEPEEEDKPLPKLQIFLLSFARMIEPMAFFGIFPFIPKMIAELGDLEDTEVGFYSGAIESAFSLTQMCLMISWGQAADRIGRKPVLVSSLGGVAIATALFGLSTRIWQLFLFRCCAGIFAGTIVTVRTMLSENSTPKTQARAFSFFAFSGNLGIFLGPLIGGVLSTPAEQYPSLFGSNKFLKDFPYALPTFANGAFGAAAAISCGVFIKETLKRKDENNPTVSKPLSTLEIIKSPGVIPVLFLYGQVMMLGLGYTAITNVFWYTPPADGGYGFSPIQNSAFIASVGVSQALWLLLVFPPVQRKVGTRAVVKGCLYVWPIFFISSPFCNFLLRRGWTTAFWIIAPPAQMLGTGVAMSFTGVQLVLNDIAPSPQSLGTLNAIALTLVSGIRTVCPGIFTSIFAAGATSHFMGGYLIWVVLIAFALLALIPLNYIPEKADGSVTRAIEEHDD